MLRSESVEPFCRGLPDFMSSIAPRRPALNRRFSNACMSNIRMLCGISAQRPQLSHICDVSGPRTNFHLLHMTKILRQGMSHNYEVVGDGFAIRTGETA